MRSPRHCFPVNAEESGDSDNASTNLDDASVNSADPIVDGNDLSINSEDAEDGLFSTLNGS